MAIRKNEVRTRKNAKHVTKDKAGKVNGFLIPVFNVHDGFLAEAQHPKQVYVTVVSPGTVKGPHLHVKRWGVFTCIKGNVKIVMKTEGGYVELYSGERHDFCSVQIPAGTPAAIQCLGDEDAYVLNMPSPAWHVDDQDDHPVSFDDYTFTW
jgi:dTDP-4-dehydrorhamnose 3,5-epimerase-like enzyme